MKITHIALWVQDLEKMKDFYCTFFNGKANEKYINPIKEFSSYFIRFSNDCTLEIMHKPDILDADLKLRCGFAHIAFSVGSKKEVDKMTKLFENKGYTIASQTRTTGDGYYESVIADPENNLIEITV